MKAAMTATLILSMALPTGILLPDTPDSCDDKASRAELRARVGEFYRAASEARWKELYAFVASETRRGEISFDAFVEKFQRLSPNVGTTVRVSKIECEAPNAEDPPTWQASAQLWLKVGARRANGRYERFRNLYAQWVRVAGKWFWLYDTSDGCDRPSFDTKLTAGGS